MQSGHLDWSGFSGVTLNIEPDIVGSHMKNPILKVQAGMMLLHILFIPPVPQVCQKVYCSDITESVTMYLQR
jgi:hypothetical protein